MSRKYDSTVARIAGDIASGLISRYPVATTAEEEMLTRQSVRLARAIVSETARTQRPVDVATGKPV